MSNIPTVAMSRYPALHNADKATAQRIGRILEALRAGNSLSTAAGLAGISKDTLARWAEAEEAFAADIGEAQAAFTASMVSTVKDAALGRGDWKAAAWALQHTPHTRAEYGQSQTTGSGGINIILGIKRDDREGVTIEAGHDGA